MPRSRLKNNRQRIQHSDEEEENKTSSGSSSRRNPVGIRRSSKSLTGNDLRLKLQRPRNKRSRTYEGEEAKENNGDGRRRRKRRRRSSTTEDGEFFTSKRLGEDDLRLRIQRSHGQNPKISQEHPNQHNESRIDIEPSDDEVVWRRGPEDEADAYSGTKTQEDLRLIIQKTREMKSYCDLDLVQTRDGASQCDDTHMDSDSPTPVNDTLHQQKGTDRELISMAKSDDSSETGTEEHLRLPIHKANCGVEPNQVDDAWLSSDNSSTTGDILDKQSDGSQCTTPMTSDTEEDQSKTKLDKTQCNSPEESPENSCKIKLPTFPSPTSAIEYQIEEVPNASATKMSWEKNETSNLESRETSRIFVTVESDPGTTQKERRKTKRTFTIFCQATSSTDEEAEEPANETDGKIPDERIFIEFGLTTTEQMERASYLPTDEVPLFWPDDLVLPDKQHVEDGLLLYFILLCDLCTEKYNVFLDHLLKGDSFVCNGAYPDVELIHRLIHTLEEKTSSMLHEDQLPDIAKLVDNRLVLCIDDRLDGRKIIRRGVDNQQQIIETYQPGKERVVESEPVDEDIFQYPPEIEEKLERQCPEPEKPAYMESQIFLAENLLARIKIIMGDPLEERFKKFRFQIYTPRANMLESQTRNRLMRPDAECFSTEVYECHKTLHEAAEKCVNKYQLKPTSRRHHAELKKEARENPDTFILIIADEAHWGPTSEAAGSDDDQSKESKSKMMKAYTSFINTWNEENHPNVLVLQVSATPYNLLTKNTRIDLHTKCKWEVCDGKRALWPVNEEDSKASQVRLCHMKWEELFEHDIQQGLNWKIKIPLKDCNKFLMVDDQGEIKGVEEEDGSTEIHIKGESSEEVKIQVLEGGKPKTLVVCKKQDGTARGHTQVRFVPEDGLNGYHESLYTFRVTLHGMDVFMLETHDQRYKLIQGHSNAKDEPAIVATTQGRSQEDKVYRDEVFVVCSSQPEGNLATTSEYISLNFLFNSSVEEFKINQYLRGDELFSELCNAMLKEGSMKEDERDKKEKISDILTAEYAVHMLHVLHIRKCTLEERNLDKVLEAMHQACGSYTRNRDELIERFLQRLEEKQYDKGFSWIDGDFFLEVLHHLEERSKDSLRKSLERYLLKLDTALDVCSFLVECLLFLREDVLKAFQDEVKEVLTSNDRYKEVFSLFQGFDFEDQKKKRVAENETCRLIDDLVLDENVTQLKGPMKIVRMSIKSGNRMYATLCLARGLVSKSYTFEILRDYDSFSLDHATKNTDVSSYRIQQMLQCRDCNHVEKKTYEKCQCTNRERNQTDLTCLKCNHLHTEVKGYIDLKDLSCLVILVQKGRMGDTFPDNFNAMDLRASTTDRNNPTLTPLVQELGRLCRYVKKDKVENIPYALLGEGLAEKLVKYRQMYGTFFEGYDGASKDAYIDMHNKARNIHADYSNRSTHKNRILFEAEPQIGKTGVYLCLVSLLRKLIEEQKEEEEELVDTDKDEIQLEGIAGATEEDWARPFWKNLKRPPGILSTYVTTGKYVPFFGPYKFGDYPEKMVGTVENPESENRTRIIKHCKDNHLEFRTYPKTVPFTLPKSPANAERKQYEVPMMSQQIKLCIPTTRHFIPLFQKVGLEEELVQKELSDEKSQIDPAKQRDKLITWIFTPSFGRSRKAYLNYDQTMVGSKQQAVQYVHIIVVRPTEYDSYVLEWGYRHAVVCLPESMPEAPNIGPEEGGVGYARLFIQLMAEYCKLPAVFMLDDTIQSVSRIIVQEDGSHSLQSVSMFVCLKDLEMQLYGRKGPPPKNSFEPYPKQDRNTQESFTGPWEKYGIIGMLRNSRLVCSYKNPFGQSHVVSAVLVNIEALARKNLRYKPWQVWEDLEMNNQCDAAGLWVVKYNMYVVRKVFMSTWLPVTHKWNEATEMTDEVTTSANTNCLLMLKQYITLCHVRKIEIVPSLGNAKIEDVGKLMGKVTEHEQGHHLVAVDDEETAIKDIQVSVAEAYTDQRKVMLLLPACICRKHNLKKKDAVKNLLESNIQNFDFDCFTSEDVCKKPVCLVLIHIQGQEVGREQNEDQNQKDDLMYTVASMHHVDDANQRKTNPKATKAINNDVTHDAVSSSQHNHTDSRNPEDQERCGNCEAPIANIGNLYKNTCYRSQWLRKILPPSKQAMSKRSYCNRCGLAMYKNCVQLEVELKMCRDQSGNCAPKTSMGMQSRHTQPVPKKRRSHTMDKRSRLTEYISYPESPPDLPLSDQPKNSMHSHSHPITKQSTSQRKKHPSTEKSSNQQRHSTHRNKKPSSKKGHAIDEHPPSYHLSYSTQSMKDVSVGQSPSQQDNSRKKQCIEEKSTFGQASHLTDSKGLPGILQSSSHHQNHSNHRKKQYSKEGSFSHPSHSPQSKRQGSLEQSSSSRPSLSTHSKKHSYTEKTSDKQSPSAQNKTQAKAEKSSRQSSHATYSKRQLSVEQSSSRPLSHESQSTKLHDTEQSYSRPTSHKRQSTKLQDTEQSYPRPLSHESQSTKLHDTEQSYSRPLSHESQSTKLHDTEQSYSRPPSHKSQSTILHDTEQSSSRPQSHKSQNTKLHDAEKSSSRPQSYKSQNTKLHDAEKSSSRPLSHKSQNTKLHDAEKSSSRPLSHKSQNTKLHDAEKSSSRPQSHKSQNTKLHDAEKSSSRPQSHKSQNTKLHDAEKSSSRPLSHKSQSTKLHDAEKSSSRPQSQNTKLHDAEKSSSRSLSHNQSSSRAQSHTTHGKRHPDSEKSSADQLIQPVHSQNLASFIQPTFESWFRSVFPGVTPFNLRQSSPYPLLAHQAFHPGAGESLFKQNSTSAYSNIQPHEEQHFYESEPCVPVYTEKQPDAEQYQPSRPIHPKLSGEQFSSQPSNRTHNEKKPDIEQSASRQPNQSTNSNKQTATEHLSSRRCSHSSNIKEEPIQNQFSCQTRYADQCPTSSTAWQSQHPMAESPRNHAKYHS